MIKKIIVSLLNFRIKTIVKINRHLLKKSFAAAEKEALKLKEKSNCKVWVFLWDRDYVAIPKWLFKKEWHNRKEWKKQTIEQWQKYVHEY